MRKSPLVTASIALAFSVCAAAQDHSTTHSDTVKWGKGPAAYAPGAQMAVIRGDPSKEGPYVVRLKVPAGFAIAPHTHPNDENVTVLSGSFGIGTGDKFDKSKITTLKTGGYSHVGKGMAHYAYFAEETVIQLHGTGPQGITYVNPNDDPRKQ
ncbi:MAG TPA: cupin domain-containing protein [Thermoanaerobaculia bacterium]|nr:cupin domain-containing protein [Thermoanaerobaculia bacterium]